AAVLMQTVADTTPPLANAGADFTVNEDTAMAFNGFGSTDNVEIVNYTWTFVDGGPRSLFGPDPSYAFATPGTYVVTLTVRDAVGSLSAGNHTIQVIAYDASGNSASQIRHVTVVAGSGGGLLPNVVVFGGLILLVLAGVAGLALVMLRRRRPRPPAVAPSPPPSTEVVQGTTARVEEPPTEPVAPEPTPPTAPDPDFDLPLQ